jgi:hypothetical protein
VNSHIRLEINTLFRFHGIIHHQNINEWKWLSSFGIVDIARFYKKTRKYFVVLRRILKLGS